MPLRRDIPALIFAGNAKDLGGVQRTDVPQGSLTPIMQDVIFAGDHERHRGGVMNMISVLLFSPEVIFCVMIAIIDSR